MARARGRKLTHFRITDIQIDDRASSSKLSNARNTKTAVYRPTGKNPDCDYHDQ
jgi:hypothetical protein